MRLPETWLPGASRDVFYRLIPFLEANEREASGLGIKESKDLLFATLTLLAHDVHYLAVGLRGLLLLVLVVSFDS